MLILCTKVVLTYCMSLSWSEVGDQGQGRNFKSCIFKKKKKKDFVRVNSFRFNSLWQLKVMVLFLIIFILALYHINFTKHNLHYHQHTKVYYWKKFVGVVGRVIPDGGREWVKVIGTSTDMKEYMLKNGTWIKSFIFKYFFFHFMNKIFMKNFTWKKNIFMWKLDNNTI